ncbi:MAG: aromatic ring-hydroxylating dioxygenase subunit alpha [Burkholderiaceae bacterium]|nr:aromatic ring-hydroxylating dioxygenase subunit alpha [Burkholderiaceae bacterium]
MLNAQDNALLTQTGPGTPMGQLFRHYWMPALLASELPHPDCAPVKLRILGENYVAFRDSQGRIGVVEPTCPHRGADLFFGRNEEGGLRCVYHGWKFDVAGQCLEMPTLEAADDQARQKICSRMRLKSLAARESAGIIWVYMAGEPEQAPPLPALEFMTVPASHRYVSKKLQQCNWAQACEGGLDTAHFSYLHMSIEEGDAAGAAMNQSALVASGNPNLIRWVREDGRPRFSVLEHEAGLVIGGARRADAGALYWRISQFLMPNHGLTPAAFKGENYHGQTWVPIDDHSCWIYCYTWNPERPLTDAERAKFKAGHAVHAETDDNYVPLRNRENLYLLDRQEQRTRSFTGVKGVSEQDACIQDSQGYIVDRTREHLGATDVGVVRFRKRILQELGNFQHAGAPSIPAAPLAYHVRSGSAIAPATESFEQVMLARFGHLHGLVPAGMQAPATAIQHDAKETA